MISRFALFASGAMLVLVIASQATAQDTGTPPKTPVATPEVEADVVVRPREKCRIFQVDVLSEVEFDTMDLNQPVGKWVDGLQDNGWLLHHTDFEVGQKSTGYPMGFMSVCMRPS